MWAETLSCLVKIDIDLDQDRSFENIIAMLTNLKYCENVAWIVWGWFLSLVTL
jgi:hypothetical protein